MRNKLTMKVWMMMAMLTFTLLGKAQQPIYKEPGQPVERRVTDLMGRMTLEEKVAQMCQYVGPGHIRETQKRFKGQKIAKGDDANGFYPNLSVNQLLELTEKGLVGSFLHVVTACRSWL